MYYLIEQLIWFLLVAFAIGMIVGWVTSQSRGEANK